MAITPTTIEITISVMLIVIGAKARLSMLLIPLLQQQSIREQEDDDHLNQRENQRRYMKISLTCDYSERFLNNIEEDCAEHDLPWLHVKFLACGLSE
ncbi:hypothetical protein HQ545_04185 [Candidatus Woesearchaeota archaeon]|nr:hypothetical protein [Candidatus Woesearchaeota archaeon]